MPVLKQTQFAAKWGTERAAGKAAGTPHPTASPLVDSSEATALLQTTDLNARLGVPGQLEVETSHEASAVCHKVGYRKGRR